MDERTKEPMWDVDDVATFLGVPVKTLYRWRYYRTGPQAHRVGKYLRYFPSEVVAWLDAETAA